MSDCQGYSSSMEMARVLASYIDDPEVIRTRILEDFDRAPAHVTIERMRAKHLAGPQRAPEAPLKPHEGYYPADVSERAASISTRFLAALERERAISAEWAKAMGALDSPALRQQSIVDRAWERETELAWRRNDEVRR
jgi:hypothetical protein